jgi:hypothetical protein
VKRVSQELGMTQLQCVLLGVLGQEWPNAGHSREETCCSQATLQLSCLFLTVPLSSSTCLLRSHSRKYCCGPSPSLHR